ncbi:hypothetical protein EU94_1117 [Prochlorococcus marinus str. MIT 9123]|uniref:hypothetical protein n=1 Tax=Prochlorococcus TaxID=1218 RepID=UPI000517538D|nr:hypothetical protein [Prochlorococcus marinus]KGF93922.1 hypothetical protein EU94_1117 [Prochlorococcus marinus str. MIT 9123]
MYRPYVEHKGCHPIEYYESALIDLVKNLKEQLDLLRKAIAYNQLKESKNQFLALESKETEILSYIHKNIYHQFKEPIYSKEEN